MNVNGTKSQKRIGPKVVFTIGMSGQFVLVQMEIKLHLKKLGFMKLQIALQEQVKFSFG